MLTNEEIAFLIVAVEMLLDWECPNEDEERDANALLAKLRLMASHRDSVSP